MMLKIKINLANNVTKRCTQTILSKLLLFLILKIIKV